MTNYDASIEVDLTPAGQARNRLAQRARLFRYDPVLERAADMFDENAQAWLQLPVLVQDLSGIYRDQREDYRAAVEAGAVPDDRGPKGEDQR